jgi:hypothetical protein
MNARHIRVYGLRLLTPIPLNHMIWIREAKINDERSSCGFAEVVEQASILQVVYPLHARHLVRPWQKSPKF